MRLLRKGMPGAAMVAFNELSETDLQTLVDDVCRLREAGAREQYLADCGQSGEPPDESECREYVRRHTTASEELLVPEFSVGDAGAMERGRTLFQSQGCTACHGAHAMGAPDVALEDAAGNALRARDLVYEPLKGGPEPASIYQRIRLGFPSGPMPAHTGLSHQQTADLVNYVISLSQEPKRILTNHQLRRFAVRGQYLREFGEQLHR